MNVIESNEEYLGNEISESDLEEELNKTIQSETVSDIMSEYLKYVASFKLLSREEELIYTQRYGETKDEEAKEKLFNHNLRLVIYIAKKYNYQNSLTIMDLIQEGNIGLMVAIERFDYTMGYRFSTYACNWIRQAITRSIANTEELIRLPVHYRDALAKYNVWKSKYFIANEKAPNDTECKKKLEELKLDPKFMWSYSYLDAPVGDDGDNTCLGDLIPNEEQDCESKVILSCISDQLIKVMNSVLTEKERTVIKMYYGLDDGRCKTLEEVGKTLGVTRERIRQIRDKALRKLRFNRELRLLDKC